VLFPSAGFLSVFTFLVALQPPEAFEGLLVIPVLLSGRLGPRAGLIGAVTAVGLHSLVLSATGGAIFRDGVGGHVLGTWLIFAAVGAVSGTMSPYPRAPGHRAKRAAPNEIEALAEIGRIISSSLDVDDIYQRLAQQVRHLIRFDRMSVFVVDFAQGTASTAYTIGVEMPGWEPGVTHPWPGTGAAVIIRTGADVVAESSELESPPDKHPVAERSLRRPALRSTLQVPLISNGHPIGVLALDSLDPDAYSQRNLELAQQIGAQIAGAVANAQLHLKQKRAEIANVELEQRFRRANKLEALAMLAGGVAHDINNLLTPIITYSALGRELVSPEDRLSEYLREIERAGECAAQLTRQLLTSSRQQVIRTQVIDVNSMIMNVDKMLRRIVGEHIELVFLPGRGPVLISVASALMEQVLINLVVNARDAMPGGGRIVIETDHTVMSDEDSRSHSCMAPGEYVTLSVSDTGTGIPADAMEHIFDPFFTTKQAGQGTGLGLSTSRGTVSQIGGHIAVESEPGRGSTFVVYLPEIQGELQGARAAETAHREMQSRPAASETVMVAEDEGAASLTDKVKQALER
jgi:signal transduction histidine kinase